MDTAPYYLRIHYHIHTFEINETAILIIIRKVHILDISNVRFNKTKIF